MMTHCKLTLSGLYNNTSLTQLRLYFDVPIGDLAINKIFRLFHIIQKERKKPL